MLLPLVVVIVGDTLVQLTRYGEILSIIDFSPGQLGGILSL